MFWKADLGYLYLGGKKAENTQSKPKPGKFISFLLLYCGVFLPVAAAAYESVTHLCAQTFFDPLPGALHTLLFILIPVSNFLVWLSLRYDLTPHYGFMIFANGMAVGVGLLYTLMFLPIMPISCVATIIGLGFFGLAPFISLISLWRGSVHLNKLAGGASIYFQPHQVNRLGHLAVLAIIVAVELPSTLTRIAIDRACQGKQQGLDILRTVGNKEVMLRACYERSGRATDILGSLYESGHRHDVDQVRQIFYHTTGRSFNSLPIPASARATIQHVSLIPDDGDNMAGGLGPAADDEFDADPDVAGEMVSGVSRGLSVSKSRLRTHIDADAAIAQCDWYLALDNISKYDREMRAKIKLPAGAVVDGASLLVNNKEYESVILVREKAREVYKKAVAQRQNPLLVSTCGPDTVLVQCYPVPPKRDIQLHLRIIAPLVLDSKKQGVLSLPQFEERNFQVDKPQSISIYSTGDITFASAADFKKSYEGNRYVATGNLSGAALACGQGLIHISRREAPMNFVFDSQSSPASYIKESLEEKPIRAPKKLRIVIDGSNWLAPRIKEIAEALRSLPADMEVLPVVVTDKGDKRLCSQYISVSSPEFNTVLDKLVRMPYVGGQYDFDALWSAVRSAHKHDDVAALWIHGPQPYTEFKQGKVMHLFSPSSMERFFSLHPDRTLLYDLQVVTGPNEILAQIKDRENITKIARYGSVGADLKQLFDSWSGTTKVYGIKYEQILETALIKDAVKTNLPIAKLWAARLITGNQSKSNSSELLYDKLLAEKYHIVTPISSAVLVTPISSLYTNWSASPVSSNHRARGLEGVLFPILNSIDLISRQTNQLNGVSRADEFCVDGSGRIADSSALPAQEKPGMPGVLLADKAAGQAAGQGSGLPNSAPDPAAFSPGQITCANPLVPESDSWLLLAVTGLILGGFLTRNRKKIARRA